MRNRGWLIGCACLLLACDPESTIADASESDAMNAPDADTPSGGSVVVRTEGELRVATFTTAEFVVAPLEERFVCQNFPNPFSADVSIVRSTSSMAAGSHHMFAFQQELDVDTVGGLADCSGLEFGPSAHSAQVPERTISYPDGIARAWPAAHDIRIQAHYFNTTSEPITARVIVELFTSDRDDFELSASIFYNNLGIGVAPHATGSAERTCTLPQDIELMNAISHMHQYGTRFTATLGDGTVLYETTDWAEPEAREFEPPLHLPAGTEITYRCEYNNTSDDPLTFGESAKSNEMCIFGGQFFPAPNGGIGCN